MEVSADVERVAAPVAPHKEQHRVVQVLVRSYRRVAVSVVANVAFRVVPARLRHQLVLPGCVVREVA